MTERDPGYGPPPGNPTGPARGGGVPFDFMANGKDTRELAGVLGKRTLAEAKLIHRDNPLVTIQNTWTIDQVRSALYAHLSGIFYSSGMLCDSMLGDDRIAATLNSRAAGWLGRELCTRPGDDTSAAKECHDAWCAWLPRFLGDSAIREQSDYGTMMGVSHGQLIWSTEERGLDYAPRVRPWHPVFTYYDWVLRCFMAVGQDGVFPIVPGTGKWIEFAPFGSYRGWIRGAIRPCAEPWLLRHFGFRDMARFGEVHGNPTRLGYVPIVGDPEMRKGFETSLANLGADSVMMLPRGVDPQDGMGYDYVLREATSKAWEVHPAQIDRCDMAIVLAILMVNLTTQVEGGSYGAAKAQMDVRSEGAQLDNETWKRTLYEQVARPFAYLNFGDANLAPWTWWDVKGPQEYAENARQFQAVATAVETLRRGGMEFSDVAELRAWLSKNFGLKDFPAFDFAKVAVTGEKPKTLELTPSDLAAVVTVNEARGSVQLPAAKADGELTVAEFKAKHADVIAKGAAAEDGATEPTDPSAKPPAAPGGFGTPKEDDDDA